MGIVLKKALLRAMFPVALCSAVALQAALPACAYVVPSATVPSLHIQNVAQLEPAARMWLPAFNEIAPGAAVPGSGHRLWTALPVLEKALHMDCAVQGGRNAVVELRFHRW